MSDPLDPTFIQARIDAAKARILLIEAAISAIASGSQSYTMETGQTRTVVTKANLTELRKGLDAELNLIRTLGLLLCGDGATHVTPGF